MQVNDTFFYALVNWQAAKPDRSVTITLGDFAQPNQEDKVWIYDANIPEGAFIESIDELCTINLLEKKKASLQQQLDVLK